MMITRQSPGFDAHPSSRSTLAVTGIEHRLGYGVGVGAAVALLLLCESA
jgi:hypothetical protein